MTNYTITAAQKARLAPYEGVFRTWREGHYVRAIGSAAIDVLAQVKYEVTGSRKRTRAANCSTCATELVADCATLYFDTPVAEEVQKVTRRTRRAK